VISFTYQGKIRTLNELSPDDHKTIIEEIRCTPELTTAQKEESVAAYVDFSQHVSRMTYGIIIQGEDLDVMRTVKKIVDYNEFIEFVQLLPERDALIAKLLYFGAPTMDEVLDLRVNQVNAEENIVKFHEFSMKYPKHVILELGNYLKEKEGNEYVFKKVHGERIERTHLNNCFNRSSRKTSKNTRITLKMLLESDIAKSRANERVYEDLAIQ
jgi:integrase